MLIRKSKADDFQAILAIINDAAHAYRGVIPADRWHDPYMPADELAKEIDDGVVFWAAEDQGRLVGVMGIQDKGDVALVRHAYTQTTLQRKGVGTKLLRYVEGLTDKPILIGTWADASWAIDFYQRNGFTVVANKEKDALLRRYWSIPVRQIETSIVLANRRWMVSQATPAYGRRSYRHLRSFALEQKLSYASVHVVMRSPRRRIMSNGNTYKGNCFCGAVQFTVSGEPAAMGYCHCESCRHWSAGPVNAFTLWKPEAVQITHGADNIGTYNKTPHSYRKWCKQCGGHILTEHPGLGLTDVYAAVIPDLPHQAAIHVHYQEAVLHIKDGLPKMKDVPKEMGGSGIAMAE